MSEGGYDAGSTSLDAQRSDRQAIVWSLNSGSLDEDESATAKARAQLRGRYTRQKSYAVVDLWQRSVAEAGGAVRTIAQMPIWSKAYASFVLNGFDLPIENAEFALERLLSTSLKTNPLAGRIVATHERIAADLHPEHAATPQSIAFHVATWTGELLPQAPWLSCWLNPHIRDQNLVLVEENRRLRKLHSADFDATAKDVKRRAKRANALERAQVYTVILARRLFPELGDNPSGLAEAITNVVHEEMGPAPMLSPLRKGGTRRTVLTKMPAMITAVKSGFEAIGLARALKPEPPAQTK